MILSFRHKGLEQFFKTGSTAGIQAKHANRLRLILATLENAETVYAMNVPNWHLHQLSGKLADHWSVKVDENWRITFQFKKGNAEIVDYQDYH